MSLVEFLQELVIQGWEFWLEDQQVCFRAPELESTAGILAQLKQKKAQILKLLQERSEILNVYPLSYGAKGLWFLWQLAPQSHTYNASIALRIYSQVDIRIWQEVFQSLRQRHPILRSTFPKVGEQPIQQVHQNQPLDFLEIDASTWNEDQLRQKVQIAHRHPFDITTEPIMRVRWFTCSEQDHIMLITIQHIAWDGWSRNLIVKELPQLYQAICSGVESSLPPLKYSYSDYVLWQRELLGSPKGERLWNYWQEKLAGELPVLNLPTDKPRPPIQTDNGGSYSFRLSQKLTEQLKQLAQQEEATLYMLLLAAFQVLLFRYTNQEEILVGSPTNGRSRAEFAPIIGYFVDSMVMRANLSGNPSFKEFLAQVNQTVLRGLAHQDYPFPLLVERLQPERDPSRSPLFQAYFILQKLIEFQDMQELFLSVDLKVEKFVLDQFENLYDLSLGMVEEDSSLLGFFQYNADLFEQQTIARMASHFETLLAGIVTNPQQRVGKLPLLSQIEQQQVLNQWNDTKQDIPTDKGIDQLFESFVEKTPEAIAVIFENQELTYSQINQKANQLTHYLLGLGITSETPVGIYLDPTPERIIALLAILKAGGAYVPIDSSHNVTSISVILTQHHLKPRLPQNSPQTLCLDTEWEIIAKQNTQNPDTPTTATNLAYILNQVLVEHQALTQRLLWLQQILSITNNDILLHQTSLTHEVALLEIGLPLISGGSIVIASTQDPTELQKLIAKHYITIIHLWPSQLSAWLNTASSTEELSHWRSLLCSGELLSTQLANTFTQRFNVSLENFYSLPETAGEISHWSWQEKPTTENIPVGNLSRLSIYLLDQHQNPVPIGISGEIYVGGSSLARGYLQQPQHPSQPFIKHPQLGKLFRTGDIARRHNNGELEIIGARQRHVWIQGKRVQLADIETALLSAPGVEQTYLLAHQTFLVAYVITAGPWNPQQLHSHIQQQLPSYMMPQAYVPLSSLPLTDKGKVDEVALACFPVIDDNLVQRWEAQLKAVPEIEQVAVVVQPKTPHLLPLHLSDLLPSECIGFPNNGATAVEENSALDTQVESNTKSRKPAISEGEPLKWSKNAPTTLAQALQQTAQQHADTNLIYIQSDGEVITQTYSQLWLEAQKILGGLRHLGLKPQDKVIFQLEANQDFIGAFWGCVLGGFVPIPISIPPSYEQSHSTLTKLENTWQMLGQPLVLTDAKLASSVRRWSQRLNLDKFELQTIDKLRSGEPDSNWHHSQPEDIAMLLLTSGSTGIPKAVMQTHHSLLSRCVATVMMNGFTSEDISLNWFPLDHVVGIVMFHIRDVYLGCQQIQIATQVVLQAPTRWLDLMSQYRTTITWAPNFAYGLIIDQLEQLEKTAGETPQTKWDLSFLKFIINGGEAIVAKTARKFLELLATYQLSPQAMYPAWGMSETASGVTFSNDFWLGSTDEGQKFVEVGSPIPGFAIRIVDNQNQIVPEENIGCVQVKGASVTSGYYQNPVANQEAFTADGWFNTGDLGFLKEGRLTITGRQKDVIIINGLNYYSHEIEAVVEELERIEVSYTAACAVRGLNSNTDKLALFFNTEVTEDTGLLALLKMLREQVLKRIGINPDYLIPLDKDLIPKTSIGKIQRTQLTQRFAAGEFKKILKRVDLITENNNTIPDWFYHKIWRRKQGNGQLQGFAKITPFLIFIDQLGLGKKFCQKLDIHFQLYIQIEPGESFCKVNKNHYKIAPDNQDDYQQLYQSLAADNLKIEAIIHLWHYDEYPGEITQTETLEKAQKTGIYSLLFLLQTFGNQSTDYPVRLLYVASHSQSLNPQEPIAYPKATVPGLLKTIPQEMPHWCCRHLDLPLDSLELNSTRILEELTIAKDSEVAYREGERWVSALEKINLLSLPKQPLPFQTGGTYLISGGLGGIGVKIAKYLLQHYQAKLLLLGRTPLPERDSWQTYLQQGGKLAEKITAYQQLQQLGGEVLYQAVDICNLTTVQQVLKQTLSTWHTQLNGVIHLAGLMQERLLMEETPESFAQVLHPKLLGTWVLHQLIQNQPHSLFINFSSINGFFGGTTVGAYTAANSFLAAFSQYQRNQSQLNSYCLAWSMWDEMGMSRGYQMKQLSKAKGYLAVGLSQGMSSLLASLCHAPAELMVGLDGSNLNIHRFTTSSDSLQQLTAYFTTKGKGQPNVSFQEPQIQDAIGKPSDCTLVQLEKMPLTETGKIDVELLLQSKLGRKTQPRVKPRNEVERQIAQIWQEVLGLQQVGIHDNFFEVGGDSIISIQIVGRAQKAGIQLTSKQLFQNQTIAKQAAVAGSTSTVQHQQGLVTGEIPLTPIQHWFFEQNLLEMHHFNQSVLLSVPPQIQPDLLARALGKILEHHDALRLRFDKTNNSWQQINSDELESIPFEVVNLSKLSETQQLELLEETATEQQARLNFTNGPIIRVVLFKFGSHTQARLLIIIHHLAIDGVSWRILLEDLFEAYQQLEHGQTIQLPQKTTAFQDWAVRLLEYGQSDKLQAQLDYWLNQPWSTIVSLPVDYPATKADNTVANAANVLKSLSKEQTKALVQEVPSAYNTQINDVLLTALVISLAEWMETQAVLINLEGHGREELFEGVDLSRTVGWFTSIFPVQLQCSSKDIGKALKSVKEQLRRIPEHGIGYGILRYLSQEEKICSQLAELPQAQVSFNYLGQFTSNQFQQVSWRGGLESAGPNYSPQGNRPHLLDISALIVEDQLQIIWTYNSCTFREVTITNLAQKYIEVLQKIMVHCQLPEAGGYTPSDFPVVDLTQQELDDLVASQPAQNNKNIESIYPLSPLQEGMLFHTLYAPNSGVYVEHMLLTLSGNLNPDAFKQAWQQVVKRHGALRTLFAWEDRKQSLQIVTKQVDLPWSYVNWQQISPTEQQQKLEALLKEDREQGFQLNHAPLMRCILIQLTRQTYKLIWSFHHILIDGWSWPVIVKEVLIYYQSYIQDKSYNLAPVRPYQDHIIWLQQQDYEEAEKFWQKSLQGLTAPTPLVVERSPQQRSQHSLSDQHQDLTLGVTTSRALQSFVQQHRLTLATLVQAAWALLLSRYSGESEVLFGVMLSGRPASLSGVEEMVGLFTNTLPLRVQVSPQTQLIPWLQQLQQTQLELQDYSYSPLVEIQRLSEMPAGVPLFESILAFENFPIDSSWQEWSPELKIAELESFGRINYPLSVLAGVRSENLLLRIIYDTSRFEADTIARMLGHLETLLEAMVGNPDIEIGKLPLLKEAELHQILVAWNNTKTDYPTDKCIHQLFEAQVEKTPSAVALVFEEQQLTYFELNSRANQLAQYLQQLGVGPEVLVGICVERSVEMLVGLLGILKAGGAYVPLDPSYPQERLVYMLEDSAVSVLLTQQALRSTLPESKAQVVCLNADLPVIAQLDTIATSGNVHPQNLAYVIYTSGSTGQPKGVLIEHQAIVSHCHTIAKHYQLNRHDRVLQFASFSFDAAIEQIFAPLITGATLVLRDRFLWAISDFHQKLIELKLTVVNLPPSYWQQWLNWQQQNLQDTTLATHLRLVICGGDILQPKSVGLWQQLCKRHPSLDSVNLLNAYGPTEATITTTTFDVAQDLTIDKSIRQVSIGHPLPNRKIYILDSQGNPTPIAIPGELHIGGVGLARGYLNRPKLTTEKFIPNPFGEGCLYKTGDKARYLRDGNIEFIGRLDHQVKIRGFRIETREIEAVLNQHPTVKETVVVAREDKPGDKRLVSYIVAETAITSNPKLSETHLNSAQEVFNQEVIPQWREYLEERLPEYLLPSGYVILPQLPLTPNGKVDRKALPAPDHTIYLSTEFVAPETITEKALAEIWTEVLGIEQVGRNDNFFELGGHSLLATQVVSRIRQTLSVELPLQSLFEKPELGSLAEELENYRAQTQGIETAAIQAREQDGNPPPLSFAQQRLWFIEKMALSSNAYNMPIVLHLVGLLDEVALQKSLNQIITRHETLRTTFSEINSTPVQVINPPFELELPKTNLSQLKPSEQTRQLQQLLQTENEQVFNLEVDPPIRAKLFQLEATEHLLQITLHHITSDGWSLTVLLKELSAIYTAILENQPSPLPKLPIQYADFAIWQRNYLQGQTLETQLDYWKQKLKDLPQLQLPTDYPRPAVQTFQGASILINIPTELTSKLKQLTQQQEVTLFMTLLTGFKILLYRYSGQEQIAVGVPIASRNRSEIEELIGFFVNSLVMYTDLGGKPSFREALNTVKQTALEAYSHQELPFEKLVEHLQPERSLSQNPLFQVMFAVQQSEILKPSLSLPNLEVDLYQEAGTEMTVRFDLELHLWQQGDQIQGFCAYNRDLFAAETIQRMLSHYQNLLTAVVENPQQPISQLPLMGETEQQQLLVEWNNTKTNYPAHQCIHELFEAQVEKTPDAVAVVFEEQKLTYSQLNSKANQLAHYLQKLGVGPDVLVGICVERSVEMVVGLLAILKAGGAYVPLDPSYPSERLAYMLCDATVSVLLTQQSLVRLLPEHPAQVVCLDGNWSLSTELSTQNLDSKVQPSNLGYVIYTSGSTGRPKGVAMSQRALVNLIIWQQHEAIVGQGATTLQFAPVSFDVSFQEMFSTWSSGGTLVLVSQQVRRDPLALMQLLVDKQVERLFLPFVALQQLAAVAPQYPTLPQLREIITAGEQLQLTPDLVEFINRLPRCRVQNQYGPSESHVVSAYTLPEDVASCPKLPPIGRPIANNQLYILSRELEPVPIGVIGELYIGGVALADGYLNRPELTAEKFLPHPFSNQAEDRVYKTGDLARYLPDGNIEFLGRSDHQVKIRGFRIETGEIEAVLNQHPRVKEIVVVAKGDNFSNKRLIAYIVAETETATSSNPELSETHLNSGQEVFNQQLIVQWREYLKQRLPEYMVPSGYLVLPQLPLTPNGKVDRKALPVLETTSNYQNQNYIAPRDRQELQLVKIWENLLGVHPVGVGDNFFDLGGHSLLAVQLMNKIEQEFGKSLPLSTLFQSSTVEQLAAILRQDSISAFSPLFPINPNGSKVPIFCIHPGGGTAFCYFELAQLLGPEQPFYGLQALGLEKGQQPLTQVEDMANLYLCAIREVQPKGPYILLGWSFGGIVALQMAYELTTQGEEIAFLGLLDTYAPSYLTNEQNLLEGEEIVLQLFGGTVSLPSKELQKLTRDEQIVFILEQAQQANVVPPDFKVSDIERLLEVLRLNSEAMGSYSPPSYPGSMTLFRAQKGSLGLSQEIISAIEPTLGWAEQSIGKVEVETVPGYHEYMVYQPTVTILAQKLQACIERSLSTYYQSKMNI